MKHLADNNFNQNRLTDVPTPINSGDAVNKAYADTKQLKSMFNVQDYGAIGDGSDSTAAFQSAYNAASAVTPKGTVFVPRGRYLISLPVDMKGASTTGEAQEASVILANPSTTAAQWKVGEHDNTVAQFYAINQNDWTFENLTLDIQDAYTKGVAAWGGDNIHYRHIHAFDSANCTMQLMGSRYESHNPITNSSMRDCIAGRSRWNYILDGEAYNVVIADNVSYDATNRHISLDPQEAHSTKTQRGITVTGNTCYGRRPFPSAWISDPSTVNGPDFAIGTKVGFYGVVSNNYIRNWTDVVTSSYNHVNDTSPSYAQVTTKVAGLGVRGSGGIWSNNVIHIDGDLTDPMDAGISILTAAPGLKVSDNAIYGAKRSVVIDNSDDVVISGNIFHFNAARYPNTQIIGTGREIFFSSFRGANVRITMNTDTRNDRMVDESSEWTLLGKTTLTSASKTIDVSNIPPADKLMIKYSIMTTGGTCELRLRYNNDSAQNYSSRFSNDGGADSTSTTQTQISGPGNSNEPAMGIIETMNWPSVDKLGYGTFVRGSSGATIPSRREGAFKWQNTSTRINRITLVTESTGSYAPGSEVEVFGRN